MKIEPLEMFQHNGQVFHKGEARIVSDDDGKQFCDLGWAKDLDGKIETGKRTPGASELVINNVSQTQAVEVK